jgi:hypothetical protein
MITGEQVTEARELLKWSVVDLVRWSGVSGITILAFEIERQRPEEGDVNKIQTALERAGVAFQEGAPLRLKGA